MRTCWSCLKEEEVWRDGPCPHARVAGPCPGAARASVSGEAGRWVPLDLALNPGVAASSPASLAVHWTFLSLSLLICQWGSHQLLGLETGMWRSAGGPGAVGESNPCSLGEVHCPPLLADSGLWLKTSVGPALVLGSLLILEKPRITAHPLPVLQCDCCRISCSFSKKTWHTHEASCAPLSHSQFLLLSAAPPSPRVLRECVCMAPCLSPGRHPSPASRSLIRWGGGGADRPGGGKPLAAPRP